MTCSALTEVPCPECSGAGVVPAGAAVERWRTRLTERAIEEGVTLYDGDALLVTDARPVVGLKPQTVYNLISHKALTPVHIMIDGRLRTAVRLVEFARYFVKQKAVA